MILLCKMVNTKLYSYNILGEDCIKLLIPAKYVTKFGRELCFRFGLHPTQESHCKEV